MKGSAFRGYMVVLCDENSASDADASSEGFRRLGLGKPIGTRVAAVAWCGYQLFCCHMTSS
jgi:hypothetical protein